MSAWEMPYRTPADPRRQRRLPMIDRLTIETPCRASWDAMVGDDRVRYCCQCNRNVYDLTAMEADEAESFLDEHLATTGTLPCARVYRRPDGRVMTTQCPTAADRRHRRRVAGAFLAVATTVASALYANRPILAPDGPVVVDDRELHAKVHDVDSPQVQLGALIPYDDDDDDETPPIAPPEQPAPVAVTLRAGKMPLLWSAARR